MASPTLVKIKREILQFARSHGQITEAKFCAPSDLLDTGDVKYPVLYFDYTGARKERQELHMTFTVWVADLVQDDNEVEVWSDATLIACDAIAFLDSEDREYAFTDNVSMRPFRDEQGDNIAGMAFDVTLRIGFPNNECLMPEKPTDGFWLITEQGGYIRTESGDRIMLETSTGRLVTESGDYLTTEDGFKILPE